MSHFPAAPYPGMSKKNGKAKKGRPSEELQVLSYDEIVEAPRAISRLETEDVENSLEALTENANLLRGKQQQLSRFRNTRSPVRRSSVGRIEVKKLPPKSYAEYKEDFEKLKKIEPESWCSTEFQLDSLSNFICKAHNLSSDLDEGKREDVLLNLSGIEQLTDVCIYHAVVNMQQRKNTMPRNCVKAVNLGGCHHLTDDGLYWLCQLLPELRMVSLSGFDNFTEKGVAHLFSDLKDLLAVEYFDTLILVEHVKGLEQKFSSSLLDNVSPVDMSESLLLPSINTLSDKVKGNPTYHKAVIIGEGEVTPLFGDTGTSLVSVIENIKTANSATFTLYESPMLYSDLFLSDCCLCVLPYDSGLNEKENVTKIFSQVLHVISKYEDTSFLLLGSSKSNTVNTDGTKLLTTILQQLDEHVKNVEKTIDKEVNRDPLLSFTEQKLLGNVLKFLAGAKCPIYAVEITGVDKNAAKKAITDSLNQYSEAFLKSHLSYQNLVKQMHNYRNDLKFKEKQTIHDVYGDLGKSNEEIALYAPVVKDTETSELEEKADSSTGVTKSLKEELDKSVKEFKANAKISPMHENMAVRLQALHMMGIAVNYQIDNRWYFTEKLPEFVDMLNKVISGSDGSSDVMVNAVKWIAKKHGMIDSSTSTERKALPTCEYPLERFWIDAPGEEEADVCFTFSCLTTLDSSVLSKLATYLRPYVFMTFDKAVVLENRGIGILIKIDKGASVGDLVDNAVHVTYRSSLLKDKPNKDKIFESVWHVITRFNIIVEYVLTQARIYYAKTSINTSIPKPDSVVGLIDRHTMSSSVCEHCGISSWDIGALQIMDKFINPTFFADTGTSCNAPLEENQFLKHGNIIRYNTSKFHTVSMPLPMSNGADSIELYLNTPMSASFMIGEETIFINPRAAGHYKLMTYPASGTDMVDVMLFEKGSIVVVKQLSLKRDTELLHMKLFPSNKKFSSQAQGLWKHTYAKLIPNTRLEKGMRLEARDKKNPSLICAATVKGLREEERQVCIYFDGWTDKFTYWTDYDDPDLHPLGFMSYMDNEYKTSKGYNPSLQAPNRYSSKFTWSKYLNEQNAKPIPYAFFNENQTEGCKEHPLLLPYRTSHMGVNNGKQGIAQRCIEYKNQVEVFYKKFESSLKQKDIHTLFSSVSKTSMHFMMPSDKLTKDLLAYCPLSSLRSMPYRQPICCVQPQNESCLIAHAASKGPCQVDNEQAKTSFISSVQTMFFLYQMYKVKKLQFLPTKWEPGNDSTDYSLEAMHEDLCLMFERAFTIVCLLQEQVDVNEIDNGSESQPFVCDYHTDTGEKLHTPEELMGFYESYGNILQEIILNKKDFTTLPDELFSKCSSLVHLNLADNNLSEIPTLEHCPAIQELLLGNNKLTAVPPIDKWRCNSIFTKLDVSHNPIHDLPSFVYELPHLEYLNAEDIGLEKLDEKILKLSGTLKYLNLNSNSITDLPKGFGELGLLEYLGLAGVRWVENVEETSILTLETLKTFIQSSVTASRVFNRSEGNEELQLAREMFAACDVKRKGTLEFNEIQMLNVKLFSMFKRFGRVISGVDLDPQIFALKNLKHLILSHQGISEVSEEIGNLKNLEHIDLSFNPLLETVPGEISQLPIKVLSLRKCPTLKTPPKEIVSRGLPTVIGYLRRLVTGSVACKETKLMMVGLGGAGKTSLVDMLTKRNTQGGAPRVTDGIDIATWTVHLDSYGQEGQLTFSVWDFAGQTVYYNTHQFFLTDRAVYLLVWNMRLGYEHAGLDFWLSSINSHAPKAPILVVGTHADQVVRSDLPAKQMKKRFPQIAGFHYVSCYTGLNTDELSQNIIETALQQSYMGEQIPAVWVKLRNKIADVRQQKNLSLIDVKEMNDLAGEIGIIDKTEVNNAIGFLNDLGTIQRFSNQFLKSKIVVNPQWIVDVMSCVVNVFESPIKDGRFFHTDIKTIWGKYPADQHQWLLRLTEAFDLTFPLKGQNANLVPCLLSDSEPEYQWPELDDTGDVRETKIIYVFDYLPSGLFNRAQVRLYHFSDNSSFIWKSGAVLKKGGQMALVKQMKDATSQLEVKVQGSHPENMLYLIHDVFETLVRESFHGVHYDYQIPCMDCMKTSSYMEPCMFRASKIRRASELKATFLQCDNYFHTLSLTELHASMPPDNNKDFDMQIERTVNDLKNLRLDMSTDFFMLYCNGDIPNGELITHVDPRRIRDDLKALGHKVWWSDNIEQLPAEAVTMAIKDARAVIVLISKNFVKDKFCIDTLYRVREMLHKEVLLVVIESGWQGADAGFLTSDDVYVDMAVMDMYDNKLIELEDTIKMRFTAQEKEIFPECFISYCWSNSRKAVEQGTPEVRGALGWGDPRDLKEMLEKNGIPCWMDIERVGTTGGLFEDIAKGLRKAKVVVACVSDQYAESKNCQMEFRFAVKVLKLPVILAVVGKGVKWVTTEVGMLSIELPRVSLMSEDPGALEELVSLVKPYMPEKSDSSGPVSKTEDNQYALNELMELAQRNFLRQVSGFAASMERLPYPCLYVLDFLHVSETGAASKETPPNDSEKKDVPMEVDDSSKKALQDQLCIRLLCENEDSWHTSGTAFPLSAILPAGKSVDEFLQSIAGYMFRMLTVLKHSSISLDIFYEPDGKEVLKTLEQFATPDKDFKTDYITLRSRIMDVDKDEVMGSLDRCHLRSGNIIWLCKEHQQSIGDVTVLEKEEVVTASGESNKNDTFVEEIMKNLGLAPKTDAPVLEFNSKAKSRGKFMGAAMAAKAAGVSKNNALKAAINKPGSATSKSSKSKACVVQ